MPNIKKKNIDNFIFPLSKNVKAAMRANNSKKKNWPVLINQTRLFKLKNIRVNIVKLLIFLKLELKNIAAIVKKQITIKL